MNTPVSCYDECGKYGASCRLKFYALVHSLNLNIIERRGRLSVIAFAREEALRLSDKRHFMEGIGVDCTDDIHCQKRDHVARLEASNRRREAGIR